MNADDIFKKHGELVREIMAKTAKVKPDTITEEQVKGQIAKGWVLNEDYVMCLGCAKLVEKTVEDLGKMKKLECKICPMKFTL